MPFTTGFTPLLCFSEHHLKSIESSHIQIDNCLLISNYCRKSILTGGFSIFIHKHLSFTTISLDTYFIEHNTEACAVKFNFSYRHICILTTYRAPIGKFNYFLIQIYPILQKLHPINLDIIICGNININCLDDSSKRS